MSDGSKGFLHTSKRVDWGFSAPPRHLSSIRAPCRPAVITVPSTVASFDTGNFTLEFFVNAQSSAFSRPFAINASSLLAVELETTGTSALCLSTSCVFGSWTAVFGAWYHMAVMRSGAYIVWFVNGKAAAYAAVPRTANFSASTFLIGGDSTTRVLKGLLSNFRVVKAAIFPALPSMNLPMDFVAGTLVHLSAASSSAPLADASGRGVVVNAVGVVWGADAPSLTGGSLVFSGSTSSIITIPAAAVQLGTVSTTSSRARLLSTLFAPLQGDFTVEFWINANLVACEFSRRARSICSNCVRMHPPAGLRQMRAPFPLASAARRCFRLSSPR